MRAHSLEDRSDSWMEGHPKSVLRVFPRGCSRWVWHHRCNDSLEFDPSFLLD